MKQVLSIAFVLLAILCCKAQDRTGWDFIASVEEEALKTYPGPARTMDPDSLTNAIFASGRVRIGIDTLTTWQVMFSKSIDWTHVVGQQMPPIALGVPPQKVMKTDYANAKRYSGAALPKNFGIVSDQLSSSTVSGFPLIRARNDPRNRAWIAYSNDEYLMLRYVHSYPDGNQTSFYHEVILYFRRVNN